MNKNLIQKRFAKNLNTYNDNAKIQKIMAETLVSLSARKDYDRILEIGCGTGLLTEKVLKNFTFKTYTANDIVADCKEYIDKLSDRINFVHADIEKIIRNSTHKYDLIISNATFQWIENFEEFLLSLLSKLKPGGTLLFSTFGPENFREIFYITGKTLAYKSCDEYKSILDNFNHYIEEETHVLAFKSAKDVLKHLKYTGVNALDSNSWTKADMLKFETGYSTICSTSPTLTYNPLYIRIIKK